MDRRVFQPRPNGNEVRRRNAIGMAAIVLLAVWLWALASRGGIGPTAAPPRTTRPDTISGAPVATEHR